MTWLPASSVPLVESYDVALLDLDGVVYVGADAVPGVAQVIAAAVRAGMRFGYVTNNAARSPRQVGDHLRALGIAVDDEEVITSSQAASRVLAERLDPGSPVLITGTQALADEVEAVGLRAVWSASEGPAGVVQGYSPELNWAMLAEACVAVRAGALWVATNTDATLPSPRGPMPGNGSFVGVVANTTGVLPVVAGKPEPAMHAECVLRTAARSPIVVGDRLDTDIEGADRAGVPSLLVLTGLTRPIDLLAAPPGQRPTYVAQDLGGLLVAHPPVDRRTGTARCGAWQVTIDDETLVLGWAPGHPGDSTAPDAAGSGIDCAALRGLAVMAWEAGTTRTRGSQPPASAVLRSLGLAEGD